MRDRGGVAENVATLMVGDLPRVRHFSWLAGQVTLTYGEGTEVGVLYFARAR